MGADQPDNARSCERLGVGVCLDAVATSPSDIADAVAGVLETPQYRLAAQRVAEETRAMPTAEQVTFLIEAIARTGLAVTALDPRPTS